VLALRAQLALVLLALLALLAPFELLTCGHFGVAGAATASSCWKLPVLGLRLPAGMLVVLLALLVHACGVLGSGAASAAVVGAAAALMLRRRWWLLSCGLLASWSFAGQTHLLRW
jgi:hypothetical protein